VVADVTRVASQVVNDWLKDERRCDFLKE